MFFNLGPNCVVNTCAFLRDTVAYLFACKAKNLKQFTSEVYESIYIF